MMKTLFLFLTILVLQISFLQAQIIPTAPNKTDAQGLRQGQWVILYNKDWKATKDTSRVQFYRVIRYQNDLPQGTVKVFYRSGKIHWKGRLLKDRPKMMMEGKCVWYYENGRVGSVRWYKRGELLRSEEYQPDGSRGDKDLRSIEKALHYYQVQNYAKAWAILEKYKSQILAFTKDEAKTAYQLLTILATCYEKTGQLTKFKELVPTLKRLEELLADNWEYLLRKGKKLYDEGKYILAKKVWKKAKIQAKVEFGRENKYYALSCNNLGLIYQVLGKTIQAESLFLEAKKIQTRVLGKNHPGYALSCSNLATLYQSQAKYIQAESLFLEAKKCFGKKHPNYHIVCNNLSVLYQSLGRYREAKHLLLEMKDILEINMGKKHLMYALNCNNFALLYYSQGLYIKAEPLYLEAKRIYEEALATNHPDYAHFCANLAALYDMQGKYSKAESLHLEAKNIFGQSLGKNHLKYIKACHNLATSYKEQRKYSEAELLYLEAKSIGKKVLGINHPDYATICNNFASLLYIQKKHLQAIFLCQEAKKTRAKVFGKVHPDYASSCNSLAVFYWKLGKYNKALYLIQEGKGILEKVLGENHPDNIGITNNLALVYWSKGMYRKAHTVFQRAFVNFWQHIKQNLAFDIERNKCKFLLSALNRNYLIYNSILQDYIDLIGIIQNKSLLGLEYQKRLMIKSLLFNSTQKIKERIYNSGDTTAIKLYDQFIETRTRYNKALELTKEKRKLNGINLTVLSKKADSLEKVLARKSIAFAKNLEEYQLHTWQEVQQHLQSNEAAIEVIRFYKADKKLTKIISIGYMALILTPHSKFPYPVFLKNGNELEGKGYRFYRKANVKQKTKDQASYDLFWAPIHQQLKKLYPGVQRVFVSLDGVYNKINLETLRNPKTGKYLGDALDIRLVSSTKDLLQRNQPRVKSSSKFIALFGFPDYRWPNSPDSLQKKKLSKLKATRQEVAYIHRQLSGQYRPQQFLATAANEANIQRLQNPKVLHLATHGFFLEDLKLQRHHPFQMLGREARVFVENPLLRAGLYWAGADANLNPKTLPDSVHHQGVLTAQEVLNLRLDSTDLVVLSACETGRGKIQNGEGVYGLQRAFLSAGAKNVLMSLWKVDDQATQYFMQYFYESWAKDEDVRKAYRTAQRKLRQEYPSPYYWGAFVLVGQ
ncbi:MAG TPA: hypothetical protein DCS93_27470 [Microscillaceae bacterium]|nr:hypothetical protein [Microscillaceae bacterium]